MNLSDTTQEQLKKAVGYQAAELVEEGMLVGLGTGTTAYYFIQRLIQKVAQGLNITAVSSSLQSTKLASDGGIQIQDINTVEVIDLTVDGADEIDNQNRLIKGGGGALVREKIVAASSKKMIVIVDESKLVPVLGKFGLPVEILPFGYMMTIHKLQQMGYTGTIRQKNNALFVTDNGNYIYDIHTPKSFDNPKEDHARLVTTAGVVDTGFFFDIPLEVLVGYKNGQIAFRRLAT